MRIYQYYSCFHSQHSYTTSGGISMARAERTARIADVEQTLCCERVLRQETSIVHISSIGAIELRVLVSSSCAELPL